MIHRTQGIVDHAGFMFKNGFHCAEAVTSAVLEGMGEDSSTATAHATAFGGGFGRTFTEACGALSGGLIVIGHLYGRQSPGHNWDIPAALAENLRKMFLDHYGSSHCGFLRDRFGEDMQPEECCRIVQKVTTDLLYLLSEAK